MNPLNQREELMRFENITKTYDMGEVKVEALKESSFDIRRGELIVILGPSGSGKSTLLNIMGGMDTPDRGQIYFEGRSLSRAGSKELTQYRRHDIGFIFQFYNLIPDLTAYENIALAAELVDNPLTIDEVLEEVGLTERRDHFPAQLSGGEQQRVAIARALVKRPRLLLCDEPTGSLDDQTGKMVLGLLSRISSKEKMTVVIVTHNTSIGQIADRILRLRSGQIIDIIVNENPLPAERIEW
ncbi:MAG: ABC transporter ATP-binding protein [Syntrophomonadaceae bacterium]|nr:ABC transporter ATP-binding protein [Syntrophomonadaceae bacterium]